MSDRTPPRATYHLHESAYQQMERDGIATWNERVGLAPIEAGTTRFLEDVLEQPWFPAVRQVIELGCGTGPLLRWLCEPRGWRGVGVDISRSAIRLARQQTADRRITFRVGDVIRLNDRDIGRFDLAIDGHCLHCLTDPADRAAFWDSACQIVRPGGCLVLLTMARPTRRAAFRRRHHRMQRGLVYHPVDRDHGYLGAVQRDDQWEVPVRCLDHWRSILRQMRDHDFDPRLYRLNLCSDDDPLSYLSVAAVRV